MITTGRDITYAVLKSLYDGSIPVYWLQYSDGHYQLFFATSSSFCRCTITSAEDIADFEANIKNESYMTGSEDEANVLLENAVEEVRKIIEPQSSFEMTFRDPRIIRRFGNLTAASASEVLLASRAYVEQSSQAQRSVVSTSANDSNPSGSGAKQVRIVYLNSSYVRKTEDVYLNGTSAVDTVATDIRFIEKFHVIKGAAAAGAIKLMTTTGGGGSEFCGIGIGTFDAFLCHHYCEAGKSGYVVSWDGVVDDETKFKLMGRANYGGNLVDEHWDLVNLMGIAAGSYLTFNRSLLAVSYGAGAYIRMTVVPNQATTTVIRGNLYLWE